MSACFIVRAQVVDTAVKAEFDRWYQDEHLAEAVKAFGAQRAWRSRDTVRVVQRIGS